MRYRRILRLSSREMQVAIICLSNYTFEGKKPNPKAQSTAIEKIRKCFNSDNFKWTMKRT